MSDAVLLAGLQSLSSAVDQVSQRNRAWNASQKIADALGQVPDATQPAAPALPAAPAVGPQASTNLPSFAAGVGAPGGPSPNMQQALSFYQAKGLSPVAASALVAGFGAESGRGLNTLATNPGDGSDGSTSQGIAQWNGPRAQAFQQFAAARGLDPRALSTQLEFSWAELNGPERGALAALQSARTPQDATAAALNYERPAGWSAQNPLGAKDAPRRLNSTAALAGWAGSQQPAPPVQMAGGGGMVPPAGYQPTRRPDVPPGGYMAASSTGAPVPVDANGNALGYAPPGGAAAAPASRAIAAAATPGDPLVTVPGYPGQWNKAKIAAAPDGTEVPDDGELARAQGSAPAPIAAPASAPGAANPAPQPAQQQYGVLTGAAPVSPTNAVPRSVILSLVRDPDTQAVGLQLWQQQATGKNFGFLQTPDGAVVRTDPTKGTVEPVYRGQKPAEFQHFAGKDGSEYAFNPQTAGTTKLSDGGPGTTVIPNDQAIARGIVPQDFTGVVQQDSDGKISITTPPQGVRPQLVDVPQPDGTVQKQWVTPPGASGGSASANVGVPFSPAKNAGIMGPTEQKIFNDHYDKMEALAQGLQALKDARALSDQTPTGWTGTGERVANWLTGGHAFADNVANADTYDSKIKLASTQLMRAAIGGRVTNYDEKIAQDIAPTSGKSVAARNQMLEDQIAQKERDLANAQSTVEAMRAGTYFAKGPRAAPITGGQSYTPAANAQDALGQARAAIAAGADRNAVIQRLQQHGVDPSGL